MASDSVAANLGGSSSIVVSGQLFPDRGRLRLRHVCKLLGGGGVQAGKPRRNASASRPASTGGPKGRPPPGPPPAINHFPFPSARGRRTGAGVLRLRTESGCPRRGVVLVQYGVGLRPSFSSGDCCTTRRMSAQHKFELESVGLRPRIGRPGWCRSIRCAVLVASGDELEHLSQAGGGAMNSSTSHRPAAAR